MVAAPVDLGDHDLEPLVDDAIDPVVDDENAEVEIGGIRERAAEETVTAVAREYEGMEARVGHLCPNAQPEASTHRRPVVGRMEGNVRMRSLRNVLPVFVRDADVVEADAVGPPRLVQLLVEGEEVDGALPDIARNVPRIEPLW